MANIKITELNGLTTKESTDVLPIVDISANETKKITVEDLLDKNIELIAVVDTAPAECSIGDKYYNTTTKKVYTAIATDTWSETGETPTSGILYIVYAEQASYSWNGSDLISVGGGKEDIVIDDTEPTDPDVKLWIDTGEVGSAVSEITNEYSTSTGLGYSANYINNLIKVEKIGNDLTGTGTLNLSKPITDYTFILVITFGGTRSAKTSVLIPTELATTYNASDDFSGSAIQSTSVFYQTEFYFSNSTTINITGATHSGWPNTGIKAVYGIKI